MFNKSRHFLKDTWAALTLETIGAQGVRKFGVFLGSGYEAGMQNADDARQT